MLRFLVLYSTVDGQTLKICRRLGAVLEEEGHAVTLAPVADAGDLALSDFERIVIGASIRYGHHRREVYDFIDAHRELLASGPNAFFSVNLVARKPGRRQPETNPYLRKFLKQIAWQPSTVAVFAGRVDYPRYGFFDRTIIRLIMWMTKGPTAPDAVVEYTDWDQVDAFARHLAQQDGRRPSFQTAIDPI